MSLTSYIELLFMVLLSHSKHVSILCPTTSLTSHIEFLFMVLLSHSKTFLYCVSKYVTDQLY